MEKVAINITLISLQPLKRRAIKFIACHRTWFIRQQAEEIRQDLSITYYAIAELVNFLIALNCDWNLNKQTIEESLENRSHSAARARSSEGMSRLSWFCLGTIREKKNSSRSHRGNTHSTLFESSTTDLDTGIHTLIRGAHTHTFRSARISTRLEYSTGIRTVIVMFNIRASPLHNYVSYCKMV